MTLAIPALHQREASRIVVMVGCNDVVVTGREIHIVAVEFRNIVIIDATNHDCPKRVTRAYFGHRGVHIGIPNGSGDLLRAR